MILNTALLLVILGNSTASSSLLLRPNSNAVIIEIALASPIPLNFVRSETTNFPNLFKLLSIEAKILFDSATALSFLLPEPIKIAINSVSDNAVFPFKSNFSLGLSSSAQDFIGIILFSYSINNFFIKDKSNIFVLNISIYEPSITSFDS